MLPLDYPDDFAHGGLDAVWFRGVPWHWQERVRSVNPRMRVVRNPLTQVFVFMLKLDPKDPQQVYPFFGVRKIRGWAPLVETQKGDPVEAVERICVGMEKSCEFFAKHYGERPEQIEAQLKADAASAETVRVNQMIANTRFCRVYGAQVMNEARFRDRNSPALKAAYFRDAQRDLLTALERRRRGKTLRLVTG
ncbi:MAG: hypothetical protein L0206_16895 [Actinobacteria bacterium]|nr:hypothetical protein [Actinomycetota bacterium]